MNPAPQVHSKSSTVSEVKTSGREYPAAHLQCLQIGAAARKEGEVTPLLQSSQNTRHTTRALTTLRLRFAPQKDRIPDSMDRLGKDRQPRQPPVVVFPIAGEVVIQAHPLLFLVCRGIAPDF